MENKATIPIKKILIVGPIPPPFGGSGLTVKALVDELIEEHLYEISIINSSPYTYPGKNMGGFKLEKIYRTLQILWKYLHQISGTDAVLVFANPLFTFTIVPIILMIARCFHKPFFIKPVGGALDIFLESKHPIVRKYFIKILSSVDGIFSQTKLLQDTLLKYGCGRTYFIPGFRALPKFKEKVGRNSTELRVIFLGYISREKGSLVLLEALQLLSRNSLETVSCDFYGLIVDEIKDEFDKQINLTPNTHYYGILEPGRGTELISNYDVLVLPTFFKSEGHPGVIIEAMHASVPVISTIHRSIPELITNGVNGILVPIMDSKALAEAILWAAQNRTELYKMGQLNKQRGQEFSTQVVVPQMMNIIFQNI